MRLYLKVQYVAFSGICLRNIKMYATATEMHIKSILIYICMFIYCVVDPFISPQQHIDVFYFFSKSKSRKRISQLQGKEKMWHLQKCHGCTKSKSFAHAVLRFEWRHSHSRDTSTLQKFSHNAESWAFLLKEWQRKVAGSTEQLAVC